MGEVESYTVLASTNGAAFTSVIEGTKETHTKFTGVAGNTYAFICFARDTAGNIEVKETTGEAVTHVERSLRIPGDCNGDQYLDISDIICLIGFLFLGEPDMPCATHEANRNLLDWQPDGFIDVTDVIASLEFLFLDGSAHPLGSGCARIVGCRDSCQI
jgi:hypothetical protein